MNFAVIWQELFGPQIASKLTEGTSHATTLEAVYLYCEDLRHCLEQTPAIDRQTEGAVDAILKGGLCLVRLPACPLSPLLWFCFQAILDFYNVDHACAVLDASTAQTPSGFETNQNAVMFSESGLRLASKHGMGSTVSTYRDIKIPCLLIVVEKARMGDTLPAHFSQFDLRFRYRQLGLTYSGFLQDLGRSFGWAQTAIERPDVLLSQLAYKVAEDPVQALLEREVKRLDQFLKSKQSRQQNDEDSESESSDDEFADCEPLLIFFDPHLKHILGEDHQNLLRELANRFVLSAEPQIGKTGTYLHFLELLANRWPLAENLKSEFYLLLHDLKLADPSTFDEPMKVKWERFHELQSTQFPGQYDPRMRVQTALEVLSRERRPGEIVVADMGCGKCPLARAAHDRDIYHNFDHFREASVPLEIAVHTGDFRSTPLKADSCDFVVFSLSFSWGGSEKLQQAYLREAIRIAKPSGYVLILEHENYLEAGDLDNLIKSTVLQKAREYKIERGFLLGVLRKAELEQGF